VRLLAFSDLHRDLEAARALVERSGEADVVIGAGDFASVHSGLQETLNALAGIETPIVLVPGNNETESALRDACAGWSTATVLHGQQTEIGGTTFFGLGAGIPITPWDWSFDLNEEQALTMLENCSPDAVLVVHSPPRGHVDQSSAGEHLGSEAVLDAIEQRQPRLAVCGHIHESWGEESRIGRTPVFNLGPEGRMIELDA
jgi:Icc-related predicted phosphoesterase